MVREEATECMVKQAEAELPADVDIGLALALVSAALGPAEPAPGHGVFA